ncbi:MAG: DUF1116 domain-containing protein [Candidatus Eremiobacterota bacterium]
MAKISDIFGKEMKVINMGLETFHNSMIKQNVKVLQIDWTPPAKGNKKLISALLKLKKLSEKANKEGVERIINAQPVLFDVRKAIDVIPGMHKKMLLHAGPPVTWERMCGPVKGACMGALIYEGLAQTPEEAEKILERGEIEFSPCHHHSAVGPMAGVVAPSMYVYCVENQTFGNRAYCTLNEGLGKVLRFGAYDKEVIDRLKWMEHVLGPALQGAVRLSGGINIKNLTAQALQMGDECHNRNVAASTMFLKEITPYLLKSELSKEVISEIFLFITSNVHSFLNLSMAACKASTDTIFGLKNSTLVSAMARNGTDIGIRIAGLGERWFTAQAGEPRGLYFPGFTAEDANRDLGDSTVSEVAGIGGFAMASAPAIVKFIGGTPADSVKFTREMYEITVAEHRDYQMPTLDFRGTPVGVDLCKVIEKGITPIINTGIAHKKPGIGQVGAGILYAPMKCFEDALDAFVEL